MVPASLVAWRWLSYRAVSGGLLGFSGNIQQETHVEVGRDGNDGVGDLLAQVGLGDLLHLAKNHGRNLLGSELLLLAVDLDLDNRLAILLDDLVGEVLDVGLDLLLVELAANQSPVEQLANLSVYMPSESGRTDLTS